MGVTLNYECIDNELPVISAEYYEEAISIWEESIIKWCSRFGDYGVKLKSEIDHDIKQEAINHKKLYLSPNDIIEIQWKCRLGHVWKDTIYNRTHSKSASCPMCKRINSDWDEAIGLNKIYDACMSDEESCKYTLSELIKLKSRYSYTDMSRLTGLSINKIRYTLKNKVETQNTFFDWCIKNSREDLLKQWDFERNLVELHKTTRNVKTQDKVYWVCEKHNESYLCSVVTKKDYIESCNCPKCKQEKIYVTKVKAQGSLYDWCENNGDRGIQIYSEYSKENEYTAYNISWNSNLKVIWICDKGHEWRQSINWRTQKGVGDCPICKADAIHINTLKHNGTLLDWCKNNGIWGNILISEWDTEKNKEIGLELDNVSAKNDTKAYWICPNGHSYFTNIRTRTSMQSGCPLCNTASTSYPEQFIYWALKQIYPDAINRYKASKLENMKHGIEYDIAIHIQNSGYEALCIEYSPMCWHSGKEYRDALKSEYCKANNVIFIQIVDDNDNLDVQEIWNKNYIYFHMDKYKRDLCCEKIVAYILDSLGHSIEEIDIDEVRYNAYLYSKGKVEYEKSLEYLYPELAKEWNILLNRINKKDVYGASTYEAYWTCKQCNYGENREWKECVAYRHKGRHARCPRCNYDWRYKTVFKPSKRGRKLVTDGNNLESNCPEILSEWDYEKNKVTPSEVTIYSSQEAYWLCSKCGYSYEYNISSRTNGNKSCPNCGWNTVKNRYNKEAGKKIICGENDLLSQRPELCKEWDYEKNDMLPSKVGVKSTKKVWWRCPHCSWSWNSMIASRSNGTRCPNCWYSWFAAENGQPQKLRIPYKHQTMPGIQIKPEDF